MKLLLVNDSPLDYVNNDYYAVDPWIRFPVQMADHCDPLTLWASIVEPKSHAPRAGSWKVNLGKMHVVAHSPYHTFVKYYRMLAWHGIQWKHAAKELIACHDAVLVRMPSPILPLVGRLVLAADKPLVLFIAGDIEKQSDRILGSKGLVKVFYKILVKFWVMQEIKWGKKAAKVYVYNKELERRHHSIGGNMSLIRTPHISSDDFMLREDTCQNQTIKILRVSWLLQSKGLEYLLQSIAILMEKKINVRLELVGSERTPGYQARLSDIAGNLKIRDRVDFSGWIPYDKMKEVYTRNDIHVISSLAEGTPRVIVEGFACGLPLVCTNVGGNTQSLQNNENALIVPPRDAMAIAEAVELIVKNRTLRRKLIANGYATARQFSFEKLGLEIINDLQKVIGKYTHG
jgi:glycosyltransferase involved in cell wall biosynthesis